MKRHIAIVLVLCALLCGCNLIPQKSGNNGNDKAALTQNSDKTAVNTQEGNSQDSAAMDDPVPANVQIFDDASVEDLVDLGHDFLDAAFIGNTEEMIAFCDTNLADNITKDPKPYLGTKPEYNIDSVETIIRPETEKGSYQLQAVVYAIKKDDNAGIKNRFSYLITVDKVKGDYYITDFKKGTLRDGL